jgi:2-polyprenyl-3-methyl-5-hydroxy-6-metoxy-1,4-benzoquinol methylase
LEKHRFAFGKNWTSFASKALTEEHVKAAREDFYRLVPKETLINKTFLDIGFGQGLALYLAAEAGAKVEGVDIDKDNLEAISRTGSFFAGIPTPKATIGSILDDSLVSQLKASGGYDIVHSWGVLHHTGDLDKALNNACSLVKPGGIFVVAIYKKHWTSPIWWIIKYLFNLAPKWLRPAFIYSLYPLLFIATYIFTGKNPHSHIRGMDFLHDVYDWVGGFPYEYLSAEQVCALLENKGFRKTLYYPAKVPTGNNEFVFVKGLVS